MLDQRYALKEVARVLKPDGFFTFTDHTIWYLVRRMVSSYEQPDDTSRLKTIAGMLFIMFNGILYNFFGIPPLFRACTDFKWYIYLDKRRLHDNLLKNNLVIINYKILIQWRRHPILFQCTAQKRQS
jgi:SAM-dependent methyltransferase